MDIKEIIDTSAISYSNNRLRQVADQFMNLYWDCKKLSAEWDSKNLVKAFPNDSSVLADGAEVDGRTQITGEDVNALMAHVEAFIEDIEATTNIKRNQIGKIAVNIIK